MLVVVTAGPVNVAVRDLFLGGVADAHHFDVKMKFFARQWMIGIYGDGFQSGFCYSDDRSLVGLELHPLFNFLIPERGARHFLNEAVVANTVTFFRRDLQLQFVAFGFAFETFFHPCDEVSTSVEIGERLLARARVDDVAVRVL